MATRNEKAFTTNSEGNRVGNKALLSNSEKEIVQLVVMGCSNAEIGAKLFINEQAVTDYIHGIFDKLKVTDRLELVLYAFHLRLIDQS